VAVVTHDGPMPILAEDAADPTAKECAADQNDCMPSDK
jgi:hypothetical protein